MAKVFYYFGFILPSKKAEITKIRENVKEIGIEMESGDINNAYYRLMLLNVAIK